jgi:hypothetical protein
VCHPERSDGFVEKVGIRNPQYPKRRHHDRSRDALRHAKWRDPLFAEFTEM